MTRRKRTGSDGVLSMLPRAMEIVRWSRNAAAVLAVVSLLLGCVTPPVSASTVQADVLQESYDETLEGADEGTVESADEDIDSGESSESSGDLGESGDENADSSSGDVYSSSEASDSGEDSGSDSNGTGEDSTTDGDGSGSDTGTNTDGLEVESVTIYYLPILDETDEDYDPDATPIAYDPESETLPTISIESGEMKLTATITFSDGSTVDSDSDELGVLWEIVSQYDESCQLLTDADEYIAELSIDEEDHSATLRALGNGNGKVKVMLTLSSYSEGTIIPVYIENNDTSDPDEDNDPSPTAEPLTLLMTYTDSTHSSATSYNSSNPPEIREEGGSVTFSPQIYWDDGTLTDAYTSGLSLSWERLWCTDFDGNTLDYPLAYISNSGVVLATGLGDGIVSFRLTVVSNSGTTLTFDVLVNIRGNETYVSSVAILDSSGRPYGDDSVDVSQVGSALTFRAMVTMSNGTVLYSNQSSIDGLTWSNLRGPTDTDTDLYSSIDQSGNFLALSGFSQCYVMASVVGGGMYDNDVYDTVRVYDGTEDDTIGYSGSITVNVITRTDYDNFGLSATPSRTVTITDDDIRSSSTFTDWYTYRTRGESWGTLYATGISIGDFVRLAGIDPSSMQFISFIGSDGYGSETGFYSASSILGSRYRYSNYYMHAISTSAGYLGQSTVSAMIALEYYRDPGNDYNSSGYSNMSTDGCLRLVLGMEGTTTANMNRMIRCISEVTIIVDDPLDDVEEDPPTSDGTSGGGSGSGTGDGSGGGSGIGSSGTGGTSTSGGIGTDSTESTSGSGGGQGSGVWGSGGGGTQVTISLLEEGSEDGQYDLVHIIDNPWRIAALICALVALILGAMWSRMRYRYEVDIGRRVSV